MRIFLKPFFAAIVLVALSSVAISAEEKAEQGYPEFRVGRQELYNAEKYAEAAKMIEEN